MHEFFQNICRVCLKYGEFLSIFNDETEGLRIDEIIKECTDVEFEENDGLPTTICSKCVEQFRIAHNIKCLCEESDKTLREWEISKKITDESPPTPNEQEVFSDKEDALGEMEADINVNKFEIVFPELEDFDNDTFIKPELEEEPTKLDTPPLEIEESKNIKTSLSTFSSSSNYARSRRERRKVKVESSSESSESETESESTDEDYKTMHTNVDIAIQEESEEDPDKPRRQIHVCKICLLRFTNKNKIYKHLNSESHCHLLPFTCKTCPDARLETMAQLDEHVKYHKRDYSARYVCEICGGGFKNQSVLNYHKMTHTKERLYRCEICDRGFVRNTSLRLHVKTHTGERLPCEVCNKSFTRGDVLRAHMRLHTGENPFHCDQCDRRFSSMQCLTVHKYAHSEKKLFDENNQPIIKEYKCAVCNKEFFNKYKWAQHEKAHKLKYQCCYCGKKFTTTKALRRHEDIHLRTLECEKCNIKFKNHQHLLRHQRNEHGDRCDFESCETSKRKFSQERNFECNICQKRFAKASILKAHEVSHSDLKPFECTKCNKKFKRSKTLTQHNRLYCRKKSTDEQSTETSAEIKLEQTSTSVCGEENA